LCVRPSYRQLGKYEIIEGVHRFCCALDLELTSVPCIIKENATDVDLQDWQVEANSIRVETKPSDYAARLKSFLVADPELSIAALAVRLHKRPMWIKQMLKLNYLSEDAKKHLDDERIPLGSAYLIAKLPYRVQDDLLPKAAGMPVCEFTKFVREFVKDFHESLKQGKLMRYVSHVALDKAKPRLRTINQIRTEINNLFEAPRILTPDKDLAPLEVWKLALEWVLHLDVISLDKAKARKVAGQQRRATRYMKRKDLKDIDFGT
jgi:hypothetical protein